MVEARNPDHYTARVQHCNFWSHLLRLLLAVTVSQVLLIFDDLDSFEEYWLGILKDISPLEFV